jgi:hypothetical protein
VPKASFERELVARRRRRERERKRERERESERERKRERERESRTTNRDWRRLLLVFRSSGHAREKEMKKSKRPLLYLDPRIIQRQQLGLSDF